MPWPIKAATAKYIPLHRASLQYFVFVVTEKKTAMSPHGRRQMLKHFLNLCTSFCLYFDLVVNVLMLGDFLFNLLGRRVWACRALFRSIVCPRLSLYSRLAEDGNHHKSSNLFWVRCSIRCTPEHPSHQWGRRHLYHRRWLQLCTACPLKRVKFRSVTYFGTVATVYYLVIYVRTVFATAACCNVKVA